MWDTDLTAEDGILKQYLLKNYVIYMLNNEEFTTELEKILYFKHFDKN